MPTVRSPFLLPGAAIAGGLIVWLTHWPRRAALRATMASLQAQVEERRNAEAVLAARASHLALLNEITRIANSTLAFDEMLQMLADRLGDLIGADGCYITEWDEARQLALPLVAYGPMRESYVKVTARSGERTLTQAVLEAGHPIVVGDVEDTPYISPHVWGPFPARSLLGLPLVAGGQKLGALLIGFNHAHDYSDDEIARCEQASKHVALAIAKARAYAAAQRHAEQLRLVSEILHALNAAPDVQRAFPVVFSGLKTLTGCSRASLSLYDLVQQQFTLVTIDTLGPEMKTGVPYPLAWTAAAQDIAAGRPHLSPDLSREADWPAERALYEAGHVSRLCLPLQAGGQILGSLNLSWATVEGYRRADMDDLNQLAEAVVLAAERSRLYEETQRLYQALQEHASALETTVARRTAELVAANASLTDAAERLRALDHLKSQFVSNVSHELRTPLANIKLYLSLLERGKPEKRGLYLETLNREANLLRRLIEDLLDLSRLDLGKLQPVLAPVDANALAEQLSNDRAALLADRGLVLVLDIAPNLPPVLADAGMLAQVLTNLTTNAMNYTPAGGTITISTQLRPGPANRGPARWVVLAVRDTGCGIATEDLPHIFERFYRGQAASESGAAGTGLGLAICQEIINRHGGRITVESSPGCGSTFRIWLQPADTARPEVAAGTLTN